MATLTVHDESATGRSLDRLDLVDLPYRLTVRDIVRAKVREEVARHNAEPRKIFHGLVQPNDAEVAVNGTRSSRHRPLEWERQADLAEDHFERNGFFILVDDRQVSSLDEVVDLVADPHVAFVRLVPLAGG